MLSSSLRLYRNAYSGVSKEMWWLSLVTLVNRSGTMVIPFLTVYLTSTGFTLGQAGMVMTVFGAGSILGSVLGGWASDRYGFFIVQFLSLLCNGVLFFVLNYMHTLTEIAVCVFVLSAVGEAFRPANAAAIVAYSNPQNRTRSYSINRLAINVGFSLGPAVGGVLADIDYSLLFWVDGITCIAASIVLYVFLKPEKETVAKSEQPLQNALPAYRDRIFLKGMFFLLLVAICFFQMFSTLTVYYKQEVQLSESAIGALLALNGIIIALFEMILVYKLEAKGKTLRYIVYGSFLVGLSFFILLLHKSLVVMIAGMLAITIGEMLLFPFINNFWVNRTNPHNRGRYAALFGLTFSLAQVVAPVMSAQIAMHQGFNSLWLVNFLLCVIAATGFFFFLKKRVYEL